MPDSVSFYTAAGQVAFSAVATIGLPVWETQLPEPNAKVFFRQRMMQLATNYSALALSTTYGAHGSYGVPTSSSYYLVGEDNFSDEKGGLFSWDRMYSAVPTSWSDTEEFAYTFPAFIIPIAFGVVYPITSITPGASSVAIATSATGLVAGESAYFDLGYVRAGMTYHMTFVESVISVNSGVDVSIASILPGAGAFTSVTGTLREGSMGRTLPETLVVGSRVLHDYALSTVTALNTDLPQIPDFAPVNSSGYEVDTLSTGLATVPNSAAYFSMIDNGVEIVAEPSVRERWLGNIYVRKTRLVKAT